MSTKKKITNKVQKKNVGKKTQTAKDLSTKSKYVSNMRFLGSNSQSQTDIAGSIVFLAKISADLAVTGFKSTPPPPAEATAPTPESNNVEKIAKASTTEATGIFENAKNVAVTLSDKNFAKKQLEKGKLVASIVLPLPNALSESISHSWDKEKSAQSKIIEAGSNLLGSVAGINAQNAIAQAAGMAGTRYPVIDPGFFQQYSGTEPRRFSMSWDFVIETQEQANTIFNIIKNFKAYSSPSQKISNVVLMSPNFWLIKINNKRLSNALNLQPVVITQVDVDYAGSGFMDMYYDGTPKYLKVNIGFAEIRAVTTEDWISVQTESEKGKK